MNGITKWNPLTDWDPFQELNEFSNRLGTFFGQMPAHRREEGGTPAEWSPSVDIIEDDKEFLVKAELPEIRKEDVHVTVENGVLTFRGERKFEKEEKGRRYHRCERSYGTFIRSFSLPDGTDGSKARAEFKEGLLQVHLPKSEKAKPKQIEVRVE